MKKVILVILDGWGIGPDYPGNAIKLANTPTMDMLMSTFPSTLLQASGEAVGLPKGEDGNTETGHLNLGAGRIVYQDLPRINMAIASGNFQENEVLLMAKEHLNIHSSNFHVMGLIGSGGVHSSNQHLFAILNFCRMNSIGNVYMHLFTDGRDSPPTSSINYLRDVLSQASELNTGTIATIIGRYYAMDRDHRWERTKVAYDAIVNEIGNQTDDIFDSINSLYENNITDEFITPLIPLYDGKPAPRIKSNDVVMFFNYRIDRPRQLTRALTLSDEEINKRKASFDPYAVKYEKSHIAKPKDSDRFFDRTNLPTNTFFVSMTEYEKDLPVHVAFPPEFVKMPLSRVLALSGKRQLKLAESEKERFVTYYFNGQREISFPGEDVNITPSPQVATYDLKPEMSGDEQTKKLIAAITSELYDLIVINYANPDMVAHTGNLEATIKACEYTDAWIKKLYTLITTRDSAYMLITADHGNAEELTNLETGEIDTEHSDLPVPFIMVAREYVTRRLRLRRGVLGDVAPTILDLLQIEKPASMTGRSLLKG